MLVFEQYYLDCLSQASYLVGDESERAGPSWSTRAATSSCTSPRPRRPGSRSSWSSRPTSTPTSCPGTSSWPGAPAPIIAYGEAAGETEFPSRKLVDGERIEPRAR